MIFGCMASLNDSPFYYEHMTYAVYAGAGAAYGTAKSGIGIAGVGTFRPDLIMKVWRTLLILDRHAESMVYSL